MEKEAAGIRFQTRDEEPRMENLMHHVNEQMLMEEHRKQSRRKATGIDGVTKDEYNVNVEENLRDLVERMKRFSYRPMPVRRTYIPKASLTLKAGKSAKLKATLKGVKAGRKLLEHVAEVRWYSTDTNVATVDANGKMKAVGKGSCTIYAIANNGVRKSAKVTVK